MFSDFVSKQPSKVLDNTNIEEIRTSLPVKLERGEFFKTFKDSIESKSLTPEKSIYASITKTPKELLSVEKLLIKGR